MSLRFFGLDWREHLPRRIGELDLVLGDIDEARTFIQTRFQTVFGRTEVDERWWSEDFDQNKQRFCQEADILLCRRGDETVGLVMGHPSDWSSYYIRTICISAEFRGAGFASLLVTWMGEVLGRHGVSRLEGDVSPGNQAQCIAQARAGCLVTGVSNSERWGTLLRYTRFLHPSVEEIYCRQFDAMRVSGANPAWSQKGARDEEVRHDVHVGRVSR